ncbi:MAG: hypothetical protein LBF68_07655 [Christensenellaceae bacterium]|jgi:hypothetical protein|nr:hypothetical protein [Christensenellaceae bacterium]
MTFIEQNNTVKKNNYKKIQRDFAKVVYEQTCCFGDSPWSRDFKKVVCGEVYSQVYSLENLPRLIDHILDNSSDYKLHGITEEIRNLLLKDFNSGNLDSIFIEIFQKDRPMTEREKDSASADAQQLALIINGISPSVLKYIQLSPSDLDCTYWEYRNYTLSDLVTKITHNEFDIIKKAVAHGDLKCFDDTYNSNIKLIHFEAFVSWHSDKKPSIPCPDWMVEKFGRSENTSDDCYKISKGDCLGIDIFFYFFEKYKKEVENKNLKSKELVRIIENTATTTEIKSKSNIKYYIYKIPEMIELTEKQITGIVNLLRLNKPNI